MKRERSGKAHGCAYAALWCARPIGALVAKRIRAWPRVGERRGLGYNWVSAKGKVQGCGMQVEWRWMRLGLDGSVLSKGETRAAGGCCGLWHGMA